MLNKESALLIFCLFFYFIHSSFSHFTTLFLLLFYDILDKLIGGNNICYVQFVKKIWQSYL